MVNELSVSLGDLEMRAGEMGLRFSTKPGDRVVVISENLSVKIYVNNVFKGEVNGLFFGNGPIAELFSEVRESLGDFLAVVVVNEDRAADFVFYPRHVSLPVESKLLGQVS